MAFYTRNYIGKPRGVNLTEGLDDLRSAVHKLLDELGAMNQMTDQQVADAYGFADATTAAAAKAEFQSDVANLNPFPDASGGTAAGRALRQLLDQMG